MEVGWVDIIIILGAIIGGMVMGTILYDLCMYVWEKIQKRRC